MSLWNLGVEPGWDLEKDPLRREFVWALGLKILGVGAGP